MSEIEVPKGWGVVKIKDISELINGRAFKPEDWKKNGLPIIRIQNLNDSTKPFNYYDSRVDDKYLIDHGDLLFAWSGTPGTSFGAHIWKGGKAILNQHIYHVKNKDEVIDKNYLKYALNKNLEEYIGKAHGGVGLRHITKGTFEDSEILLPTLKIQKRFVQKLDYILGQLEQKKNEILNLKGINEDKMKHLMKKRDSIIISKIIPYDNLMNDWSLISVGEILESKLQGFYYNKGYYQDGVPLLRITDMDDFGNIKYENLPKIHVTNKEITRYRLEKGDLIMARTGSSRGRMVVFNRDNFDLLFAGYLIRFRFKKNVSSDYVMLCFKHPKIRKLLISTSHGGATQNINAENLKQIQIPFSNLKNQHSIVQQFKKSFLEMEVLFKALERILQIQSKTLSNLDYLQMSILSNAFSGKLVN